MCPGIDLYLKVICEPHTLLNLLSFKIARLVRLAGSIVAVCPPLPLAIHVQIGLQVLERYTILQVITAGNNGKVGTGQVMYWISVCIRQTIYTNFQLSFLQKISCFYCYI